MFLCAHCRRLMAVCCDCDRGDRYCSGVCARERRKLQQRAASAAYQKTGRGGLLHAARMQRLRDQLAKNSNEIVTQHGSSQAVNGAIEDSAGSSTSRPDASQEESSHVEPVPERPETGVSHSSIYASSKEVELRCFKCGQVLPTHCRTDGFRFRHPSRSHSRIPRQSTGPPRR